MRHLWLQPVGGYAFGTGEVIETVSNVPGTAKIESKLEGPFFGARGGLSISDSFRVGVDYTRQFINKTDTRTEQDGTTSSTKSKSNLGLFGALIGFDLPRTPFQLMGARYFDVGLDALSGSGWAAGLSFVLVNPFTLTAEYRWFDVETEKDTGGNQTQRKFEQFFFGLTVRLL